MKLMKRALSLVMASVMILSLASCKINALKGVKEYSQDEMVKVLEEKLGMDEEALHLAVNDGEHNQYPSSKVLTFKYEGTRVNAYFVDDAAEAKKLFEQYYQKFEDTFNMKEMFKGSQIKAKTDNDGYIVINGIDSGVDLFGSRFSMGDIFGAIYYSNSMLILMYDETPEDVSDAKKVVQTLGFPSIDR